MCLYPKFILNRKYLPNKKNNGTPPNIKDERTKYVPIGCGKCMECRRQNSLRWQVRLQEEIRADQNGIFVTLTFNDENLTKLENEISEKYKIQGYELDNKIAKTSVRRFLENVRSKTKKSLKHWLITELGSKNTERIHIHGIIWSDNKNIIKEKWNYGNIWFGKYVNEKTINYIIKYVNKTDKIHKYYTPVILSSPGIGKNYINRIDSNLNKYNGDKTNELYKTRNGIKLPLPIYYRNKIYTEEEREKLWLNLLNKETRYINGLKIDVSKTDDDYYKVLEQQRKINTKLGYGDDTKDWNQKQYEQHLRNLKKIKRHEEMLRKGQELG